MIRNSPVKKPHVLPLFKWLQWNYFSKFLSGRKKKLKPKKNTDSDFQLAPLGNVGKK